MPDATIPAIPGAPSIAVPPTADLPAIVRAAGGRGEAIYSGGQLYVAGVTQEALDAALAQVGVVPAPPVPDLTPLQMGLGLLAAGMLADVEALVAAGPPELRLAWQRASVIKRDDPMIAAVAAQIGLSDAAVDHLFRVAAAS